MLTLAVAAWFAFNPVGDTWVGTSPSSGSAVAAYHQAQQAWAHACEEVGGRVLEYPDYYLCLPDYSGMAGHNFGPGPSWQRFPDAIQYQQAGDSSGSTADAPADSPASPAGTSPGTSPGPGPGGDCPR